MKYFFSFAVPFLIKTTLMILLLALVLTIAISIGVKGAFDIVISGGDLNDINAIVDIEQYFLPKQFILRSAQELPFAGVIITAFENGDFNVKNSTNKEFMAMLGMELSKTLVLAAVLYLCKYCQNYISKLSNWICGGLAKTGLYERYKVTDLATDLFCYLYTIFISIGATEILLLRFTPTMSFWGKTVPLFALAAFACMPFVLGGRYRMRMNAIAFVKGPVCSFFAALCAIFMVTIFATMVYDPTDLLVKALLATMFACFCIFLLYIATKDKIIGLSEKVKYS